MPLLPRAQHAAPRVVVAVKGLHLTERGRRILDAATGTALTAAGAGLFYCSLLLVTAVTGAEVIA